MRNGLAICLVLGLAASAGAYTDPAVQLDTVVKGFDTPMPGGLPGETFWNIGIPALHQGDVVFSSTGTLGTQGIFCYCDGALVMVASRADPVPGVPNGVSAEFGPFGSAVIHEGRIMTKAIVVADGTEFTGLYEWAPPGLIPVVDRWTTLPQGQPPGDTAFYVFDVSLDHTGATFLFGAVDNTSAIYRYSEGEFEALVTFDTQIPVDPPVPFFSFGDVVGEDGDFVFYGFGSGEGGVIKSIGGALDLVADNNTEVPGGQPGEVFQGLGGADPVIGNGSTIFFAGTTVAGQGGFYRERNGSLEELVTTRTINPLTGTLFNEFEDKKSADGDAYALVAGTDNENLLYGDAEDRLYAIATKGEDLEGQIVQFMTLGKHAVSDDQVVFSAFRETDEVIYVATIGEPVNEIPFLRPFGRYSLMILIAIVGLLAVRRV